MKIYYLPGASSLFPLIVLAVASEYRRTTAATEVL